MQQSVADAIKTFFSKYKLDSRLVSKVIADDWEKIMGKTIAKYTESIQMNGQILVIKTPIPVLKQDLLSNKSQLIEKVNSFYKSEVVKDIKVY